MPRSSYTLSPQRLDWRKCASLTRRVLLVLPFVLPFLFHEMYQAFNRFFIVKNFGCGCPPIHDTGAFRFTANHFNLILWCGVAFLCGCMWWGLLRPEFRDRKSLSYLLTQMMGLYIILCVCSNRLAAEFWM